MKQMKKQEKGITLIALIITIIVLLILAGITINVLFGENSLLGKTTYSKLKTENATVTEQAKLLLNEYQILKRTDGTTNDAIEFLKGSSASKKFMNSYQSYANTYLVDYRVAIPNGSTGRGEEYKKDQYLVEKVSEPEGEYLLSYYNEKQEQTKLLYINPDGTSKDIQSGKEDNKGEEIIGEDTKRVSEDDINIQPGEKRSIQYIEDLVQLSINVNNGISYEGITIGVTRDLDFNDDSSYENPTINSFEIDFNGSVESGIKEELTTFNSTYDSPQIGQTSDKSFKGTFNGQNNILSNVPISNKQNSTTKTVEGLFGYNEGIVKNTVLNNVNIANYNYANIPVGLCVAKNNGTIENVSLTGNETLRYSPSYKIGGITYENNGTINNCKNNLNQISIVSEGAGIVVYNNNIVSNCVNQSRINQAGLLTTIGGVIGINNSSETIYNCKNGTENNATIYSAPAQTSLGGIVGKNNSDYLHIENCINYQALNNSNGPTAGIAVNGNENAEIKIINCKNYGDISNSTTNYGKNSAGILNGISQSSNYGPITAKKIEIRNCDNYAKITSQIYVAGISTTWANSTATGDFLIYNCNNSGNILCSGSYSMGGIACTATGGVIEKCTNNPAQMVGLGYMGGIIYKAQNMQIIDCNNGSYTNTNSSTMNVNGSESGGIVGNANYVTVNNCNNYMDIEFSGTSYGGGIIGKADKVDVGRCNNYATITAKTTCYDLGGIIGSGSSVQGRDEISDSHNYGTLSFPQYSGGFIIGYGAPKITNCTNKGEAGDLNMIGEDRGAIIE